MPGNTKVEAILRAPPLRFNALPSSPCLLTLLDAQELPVGCSVLGSFLNALVLFDFYVLSPVIYFLFIPESFIFDDLTFSKDSDQLNFLEAYRPTT